jgi:hypothetical protein
VTERESKVQDLLAEIHIATLEAILAQLQTEPDAKVLSVARQLLKDNCITSDIRSSPQLLKLADELPDENDFPAEEVA